MNYFAIGDIHGCFKELTSLHKKILTHKNFDVKKDVLIYLGDYIDRGKNSKQVIDQILKLKEDKINTINLLGNHDQFLIDFLINKHNNIKNWLNFGADQTFRSYNIEIVEFIKDGFEDEVIDGLRNKFLNNIEDSHIDFFKNLELVYSTKNYFFVHAGINPSNKLSEQTKEDYLWSRSKDFFKKDFQSEKVIVHGHTPEEIIISDPFRINIDSGCYFSGKLSCVCVTDSDNSRIFITA